MGTRRPRKNLAKAIVSGLMALWPTGAFSDVYTVNDLSMGVFDSVPSNLTPDGAAVSITNLHVDPYSNGLIQRGGSLKTNSSQLSGSAEVDVFTYVQQDGDEYLIAFASKTVAYSVDNGVTFTTLITTATDGAYWDCSGFVDDRFYCVTQTTSAFSFNGTAHTVTSQTPAGKFIENYENRLWVANTAANPNRLAFSDLLLPSSFTATSFIDFDEPITGIGVINGGLSVYGDNNTWMLRGDDPTNFRVDKLSNGIGCTSRRSIKNMMLNTREVQIFLSKGFGQTKNNFYANDGLNVIPIGDNYLETLAGINIGNSSARAKVWTLDIDFSVGTFDRTTVSNDSVILTTENVSVSNNDFENGSGTNADNWTESTHGSSITTTAIRTSTDTTSQAGSFLMVGDSNFNSSNGTDCSRDQTSVDGAVWILDGSGTFLEQKTLGTITTSYQQKSVNLSSYGGQTIQIGLLMAKRSEVVPGGCGGPSYRTVAQSDSFVSNGSTMTLYIKAYGTGNTKIAYDTLADGRTTITTGTFTSEQYQVDADISEWGMFDLDFDVGTSSMTFYIKTATDSASLTAASFQEIGDGQLISTTTNRFVQWKVVFSSGTSLVTPPTLYSAIVNWTSSVGASQQPDAAVFAENYWFTYPGPSEARNQSVLVINKEGAMYRLEYGTSSQHGFYGFTTSNGLLFAGDSSTQTTGGYVWKLEIGDLDDGQAITSSVQLKHHEFTTPSQGRQAAAGLEDYEKSLIAVYFNYAVQNSGSFTATIDKNFGEVSNDYTIPFSSGTTINRWKLEPNQQTTGKQIGLSFTNSTSGQKLKLYPPITYHFEKVRQIKQ